MSRYDWVSGNRDWLERAHCHWSPKRKEKVLIRWWFSQPICTDLYDLVTLEGGLQSVVCSLETGRIPDDVFADCPRSALLRDSDIQIPICDIPVNVGGDCDLPIAAISCGWFSPDATQDSRWIRKRPRAESYAVKSVNLSADWSKASNRNVATVVAHYIEFWAIGDPDMLRRLLVELPQLSSSRACGMGGQLGVEIEIGGDLVKWPHWQRESGQLMRALPANYLPDALGCEQRFATLRAPYWHRRTNMLCDAPIQSIGSPLCW